MPLFGYRALPNTLLVIVTLVAFGYGFGVVEPAHIANAPPFRRLWSTTTLAMGAKSPSSTRAPVHPPPVDALPGAPTSHVRLLWRTTLLEPPFESTASLWELPAP